MECLSEFGFYSVYLGDGRREQLENVDRLLGENQLTLETTPKGANSKPESLAFIGPNK